MTMGDPERQHIIVVDDCEELADLMAMVISSYTTRDRENYTIQTCYDPREALKSARQHRPDLLVSDVDMPWMSGPDLLVKLNGQCKKPAIIPAIFVTGASNAEDPAFAKCLELVGQGRAVYLPKPFENIVLAGLVENILHGNFRLAV